MQQPQHPTNLSDDKITAPLLKRRRSSNRARRIGLGATAGVIGIGIGAAVMALNLISGPRAVAAERTGNGPAVIELFTSQGCYSCPPAEKLLGDLIAEDPDIVALEFHVDYWNDLVYGSHGSHTDPFSSEENTFRQVLYNRASLQGRIGVYTPQMVINGQYAAIGSSRDLIREGIEVLDRPVVNVSVAHNPVLDTDSGATGLHIQLTDFSSAPDDTHLWIAVFDIEKTTVISTGENHDKTLISHNIVRELKQLSSLDDLSESTSIGDNKSMDYLVELRQGQGCAVLVQDALLGTVHGASYCPKSLWKQLG